MAKITQINQTYYFGYIEIKWDGILLFYPILRHRTRNIYYFNGKCYWPRKEKM